MDQIEKRIPSPADLAALLRMHPVEILIERLECAHSQLQLITKYFVCDVRGQAEEFMSTVSNASEFTLEKMCDDIEYGQESDAKTAIVSANYALRAAEGIGKWLEYGHGQAGRLETVMRKELQTAVDNLYGCRTLLCTTKESHTQWHDCISRLDDCLDNVRGLAIQELPDSEVHQRLTIARRILSIPSELSHLCDELRKLLMKGWETDAEFQPYNLRCADLRDFARELEAAIVPTHSWFEWVFDPEIPYTTDDPIGVACKIVWNVSGLMDELDGNLHRVLTPWQRKMLTGLIEAGDRTGQPEAAREDDESGPSIHKGEHAGGIVGYVKTNPIKLTDAEPIPGQCYFWVEDAPGWVTMSEALDRKSTGEAGFDHPMKLKRAIEASEAVAYMVKPNGRKIYDRHFKNWLKPLAHMQRKREDGLSKVINADLAGAGGEVPSENAELSLGEKATIERRKRLRAKGTEA